MRLREAIYATVRRAFGCVWLLGCACNDTRSHAFDPGLCVVAAGPKHSPESSSRQGNEGLKLDGMVCVHAVWMVNERDCTRVQDGTIRAQQGLIMSRIGIPCCTPPTQLISTKETAL
eukprot:6190035-Pleurochrysis_carterae.AAC.1